jgi:hypothetical protein
MTCTLAILAVCLLLVILYQHLRIGDIWQENQEMRHELLARRRRDFEDSVHVAARMRERTRQLCPRV